MNVSKITLVVAVVTLLMACSRQETKPESMRSVRVIDVGASATHSHVQFAGVIAARVESQLGFRLPGKVIARSAYLGEHVKAGQSLAQIDPQDARLAQDASVAQLMAAGNTLKFAEDNYHRFDALQKEQFISSAELEKYSNQLKVARAQYEQAAADAQAKKNQLRYTSLLADAAGTVTAVNAQVGQVISAGMPVVTVAQDGARDAVFSVSENWVKYVKLGQKLEAKAWDGGKAFPAVVREVAASADPVSRTFLVKAEVNPKEAPNLGSTISVDMPRFDINSTGVLKLPSSALFQDGQKTAVWVFNPSSQRVSKKNVVISTADGNFAVIESGLVAGEQVVTAGVNELRQNQKVRLYRDDSQETVVKISSTGTDTTGKQSE